MPGPLDGIRLVGESSHDHVDGPVDYSSVRYQLPDQVPPAPPLGGPHNPKWLACGVYESPVPNEYAVHSIERGAVWITYRPGLPAPELRKLVALPEINDITREYVLVSPFEGIPAPVVAATWSIWLPLEPPLTGAALDSLRTFAEAYSRGAQGGKAFLPCRTGGLTPEQANQELTDWCARQQSPPPSCRERHGGETDR